jgi:predicted RNase H-like HicB family nuclease
MAAIIRYIALVDGKRGAYGLTVPDLPGCTSAGNTLEEVLSNAIEAVRLWTEDAIADGDPIPRPRSYDDIVEDRKVKAALARGAAVSFVPLIPNERGQPVPRVSRRVRRMRP